MNTITQQSAAQLDTLRKISPLIHNITNYVTVNDVANAILAIGGSPIMADAIEEAGDIAAISSAVVLNMGTLNARTVESMILAGKRANDAGVPVVFDPVGAGASAYRNQSAVRILKEVHVDILRGNLSEIAFLAGAAANTKGVDASDKDEHLDAVGIAKQAANTFGCVAAITGEIDTISDGKRVARIANGTFRLSKVTGTGCMTSALVGAFAGVRGDLFAAAVGGVACMGIAGEIAEPQAVKYGTGSFHIAIIDALSTLCSDLFLKKVKIDETDC